jgi:hypothetical protein
MKSITLSLERPAKKLGGDRYNNETYNMTVYIPQVISRPNGIPAQKIKMTLEVEE